MARLLLLLIAIGLVYLILKRVVGMQRQRSLRRDRAPTRPKTHYEKTERCVRCGAFIPRRMGRSTDAGYVCRADCRDGGSRQGPAA